MGHRKNNAFSCIHCVCHRVSHNSQLSPSCTVLIRCKVRMILQWFDHRGQSCGFLSMTVWTGRVWVGKVRPKSTPHSTQAALLQRMVVERASVLECHSNINFSSGGSTFHIYLIPRSPRQISSSSCLCVFNFSSLWVYVFWLRGLFQAMSADAQCVFLAMTEGQKQRQIHPSQ